MPNSFSAFYEIEGLLRCIMDDTAAEDTAEKLIKRYKTVSATLSATEYDLREIAGDAAARLLTKAKSALAHSLEEAYTGALTVFSGADIDRYLRFDFGHREEEYVATILLDNENHIVGTEIVGSGSVNRCVVATQHVAKAVFKWNAASFILARNHTGQSSAKANDEDWKLVQRFSKIGKSLDFPLIDFIVVAKNTTAYLRSDARWAAAEAA